MDEVEAQQQRSARLAIGLAHRPTGTPSADRSWARGRIVRHAQGARLTLIDIYELDDNGPRNVRILDRLVDLAVATTAGVLVTDGVQPGLAERLAGDLGLRHEPVPAHRTMST